ncbi:helix-turn-helix transcriptional regulator [Bacillaceae bacterium IKA-2]|nr:helix-turn-helix transcriptional regulator [Bacillaceae bacterium IKA-2]
MNLFGLGKKRSAFGKFLDKHSISQEEIAHESKVSKSTISRLCQPDESEPKIKNAKNIIKALRNNGYKVDYDDFWDM